jgi:plasmid stability protein
MATLTLHDIPDELLSCLEHRAQAHGRSLKSEVVDYLTRLVPADALTTTPPAQLAHFAELRSHFKGPPLTSEETITAIGRDSHPPELDRFGNRIIPEL